MYIIWFFKVTYMIYTISLYSRHKETSTCLKLNWLRLTARNICLLLTRVAVCLTTVKRGRSARLRSWCPQLLVIPNSSQNCTATSETTTTSTKSEVSLSFLICLIYSYTYLSIFIIREGCLLGFAWRLKVIDFFSSLGNFIGFLLLFLK